MKVNRILALIAAFAIIPGYAVASSQTVGSYCWLGTNTIAQAYVSPTQTNVSSSGSATFTADVPRGYKVSYWVWVKGTASSDTLNHLLQGETNGVRNDAWAGQTFTEATSFTWSQQSYPDCGSYPGVAVRLDPIPYNIDFDDNGGSGSMETMQVPSFIEPVNLTPNAFSKTGYSFEGWTTNESDTVVFSDAQQVTGYDFDGVVESNDTVTLSACWTANNYTVTFDPCDGSVSPTAKTVTYDADYGDLPTPTRQGHTFEGWYTAKSGGSRVYKDTTVETASDHTLYAHWDTITYTITTLSSGTGSGTVTGGGSYAYGTQVTLTATPYSYSQFKNWTDGVSTESRTVTVLSNATYTAVFEEESTYTIVFDGNGGTCNLYPIENVRFTESVTLTKATPSKVYRNGYTFLGWSENSNATEIDYEDKESVSRLTKEASITLYAVWSPITYSIAFNANGGEGEMEPMTDVKYGVVTNLPRNAFAKPGCSFLHWQCGDSVFADGAAVSNLTTTADGTVTLSAVWDAPYWVRFEPNGGSGDMAVQRLENGVSMALTSNAFENVGHTFVGWTTNGSSMVVYDDGEVVSGNGFEIGKTNSLIAVWQANKYTVAYDAGASDATGTTDSQSFVYGEAKPLRECGFSRGELWHFSGWSNSVSGVVYTNLNESVSNLTAVADATVVLVAQWSSDLSDLSRAIDCDNLIWKNYKFYEEQWLDEPWKVSTNSSCHCGATCAVQEKVDADAIGKAMAATIHTNGVLTFWWKSTQSYAKISVQIGRISLTNAVEEGTNVWHEMRVEVSLLPSDEAVLGIMGYYVGDEPGDPVGTLYVDHLTWQPAGSAANPEPGEADRREATGVRVTSDGFTLSFTGDARFDYRLQSTDTLNPPDWQPAGDTITGTGESQELSIPVDSEHPQRFFKIETLQRK